MLRIRPARCQRISGNPALVTRTTPWKLVSKSALTGSMELFPAAPVLPLQPGQKHVGDVKRQHGVGVAGPACTATARAMDGETVHQYLTKRPVTSAMGFWLVELVI